MNGLPSSNFPTKQQLVDHAYFWLSDNSRFWFYKEAAGSATFPAVVLTDTGTYVSLLQKNTTYKMI